MIELNPRAWMPSLNRYATGFDGLCYHRQMNGVGEWWCYPAGEDEQVVVEIELPTGLKDKNGKEIYEGDIVKVNDDFDKYGLNAGEIYEVYFNAGGFRCKPKYESSIARGDKGFWIDDGNDYEVISNIHENQKLLKEKE